MSNKKLRILVLTRYGRMGASSRLRSIQYYSMFKDAGFEVNASELLPDELLAFKYQNGAYGLKALFFAYCHRFKLLKKSAEHDIIWIEKEALPWFPAFIESKLLKGVPYVLDYDDAVFHNYDLHRSRLVRWIFGSRLDHLMRDASLVIGGNNYLAKRAVCAGAPWVEVLPTVIDLDRYSNLLQIDKLTTPRIVWIGSPTTAHYLELLREPLQQLALEIPFVFRIIGVRDIDMPGVNIEYVPWSEITEVDSISSCDIGVMPLKPSPWELGKCGYKLIQYMACGLPVVASAVGANVDIVAEGINGYLVNSSDEWRKCLHHLLTSPKLCESMGQAGRTRVKNNYCLQHTGPKLIKLLRIVGNKRQK